MATKSSSVACCFSSQTSSTGFCQSRFQSKGLYTFGQRSPIGVVCSVVSEFEKNTLLSSEEVQIGTRPIAEEAPLVECQDSLFKQLWTSYNQALNEHPIPVKSATSFVGFMLGDTLAQNIVGDPFDYYRLLRMIMFGVMMDGPIGHVWYTTLDRFVMAEDSKSTKAVLVKTLLDQVLWAPMFCCVFFTFNNLFQGELEHTWIDICQKLLPTMLANYAIWPLAHIINFRYVPSQQRILYINCVQIVWSAFLSNMAARGLELGPIIHHFLHHFKLE
eukprot:TRINITY_DN2416_c0_g1_i1.p1 TRINITY_DN2416_c0_g1~~TRINITY_DN2416_c0_g1_i1.p1  ORF type:complete len:301 (-),score=5.21 TRINITY_DN2416_c0_g1_i1:893-1714(-)